MTEELKQNLSIDSIRNIEKWLNEDKYKEYLSELKALIDNKQWQILEDSFFKEIEFGTGGRRGRTGIGSNRINRVTIGESAQALCEYAVSNDVGAAKKGVVIACDTRLTSPELSEYAASVCAANGFKTYIFESFRSTPELSFAVRHLKASIGIVISASHNPPADNGFKAYWHDGGQLVTPHDKGVIEKVNMINCINSTVFSDAVAKGEITIIGRDVDDAYINMVADQAEGTSRDLSIVYSPLHGAGQTNVLPALKKVGFKNISVVQDQMVPDGNFPTVEGFKPNPEEKIANDRAVAQLLFERADIAITNDPDADRVGVIVRQGDKPVYLTGNQAAVLAANYSLQKLRDRNELTAKHYLAKTIVTTEMLSAIASDFGVTMYTNMLVGFKYIGELLLSKENTDEIFVIGGEESYGLLKGTYARDKDGATGALPLAEYAAELKERNLTLYDELLNLYKRYGVYMETLSNAYFEGATGFHRMQEVMSTLRSNPPDEILGYKITAVLDYKSLVKTTIESGETTRIDCAAGDVVVLELDNDSRCKLTIRPSGTEPKIKLYAQWYQESEGNVEEQVQEVKLLLENIVSTLEGVLLDE